MSQPKREEDSADDQRIRDNVVPLQRLAKHQVGNYCKDDQCDALLHDLQLCNGERLRPQPVCRHLKDVLKKRDRPANQDHLDQGFALVLQVPVPGDGHEYVRDHQ